MRAATSVCYEYDTVLVRVPSIRVEIDMQNMQRELANELRIGPPTRPTLPLSSHRAHNFVTSDKMTDILHHGTDMVVMFVGGVAAV